MLNKLDFAKFEDKLHPSWHIKLRPFIESEECFNIYQELKNSEERVIPVSGNTWNAFKYCTYDNIKAIFVGMCPYHTIEKVDGKWMEIADGLAFSCGNTKRMAPSLSILYDAIESDLGKKIHKNPDLNFWAQQGVLLLNTSLTVKFQKPDSHRDLWVGFMKYLFTEVLDVVTGVPIILFGDTAQKQVEKYLFPMSQPYMKLKHPAYYARNETKMEHKNAFTWVNKILSQNNRDIIHWCYDDYDKYYLPF